MPCPPTLSFFSSFFVGENLQTANKKKKKKSPIKSTWLGGAYMAADRSNLKSVLVTRQDYQEYGSAWLSKVFSGANAR